MSWSQRLRNIYKSQINALKERLDRIDAEAEMEAAERRARRDAEAELRDESDIRPALRSPEEIARGGTPRSTPSSVPPATTAAPATINPLARHYRILGLEEGADFTAVETAYARLVASASNLCRQAPEGSEERRAAEEILKRVEASFNALRDALDPTAGRFDKLELT